VGETLLEAYQQAKRNGGAPGTDGQTFADMEASGLDAFIAGLREALLTDRHTPQPDRRVDSPKGTGKVRTLQIPWIRDRVVLRGPEADLGDELRGGLLPQLTRVSTQALAASRPGGGQAQCAAAKAQHRLAAVE
jgi:hypothetical protein